MKFSVKLAGAAAALAASAMVIAPAQAGESLLEAVSNNVPCSALVTNAKNEKWETFSDVYTYFYKAAKEAQAEIKKAEAEGNTTPNQIAAFKELAGKDANEVALNVAGRFTECKAVKEDFAASTKGSAKVFGSSIASLSS